MNTEISWIDWILLILCIVVWVPILTYITVLGLS